MKRKTALGISLILIIMAGLSCLCSCGDKDKESEEPTSFELALITDEVGVRDGSFHEITWNAMQAFSEENGMACKYYISENNEEAYLDAIDQARSKGAKLVVLAGSQFETVCYKAQKEYDDLLFVLLDGVPRDKDYNYETAGNSTGVLFAEQEAGYLAGYAAVYEGYKKLGFMGGEDLPPVKRYGYGFVQGASAAAKEYKVKNVEIKYIYLGTFEASDEIESEAFGWYDDGTEVIFACGGSIGESVMAAAETANGKVIGVDSDQSGMSETVITSARKEIGKAMTDILKNYKRNNFDGSAILTYGAENDGIGLEMTNARFTKFNQETYDKIYKEIKKGDREIAKDIDKKSVQTLAGDQVKLREYQD